MRKVTVTYPDGEQRIRYFYEEHILIGVVFCDRAEGVKPHLGALGNTFQIEEVSGDLSECTVCLRHESGIPETKFGIVYWYNKDGHQGNYDE